jgi:hypothetical protein
MTFKVVASGKHDISKRKWVTQINYNEKRYERKGKKNILKVYWNSDYDTTNTILKISMTQIQRH